MPETINNPTDHDNLNTLIADVRNMKEGQDDFHQEMKSRFDKLENNYSNRLTDVERELSNVDKVYAAKVVEDEKDKKMDARVIIIEKSLSNFRVAFTIYSIALGTMIVLLLYYISGVKI